jgi:hypothetical protein
VKFWGQGVRGVRGVRYVSYGRYVRCVKDGIVLVLYSTCIRYIN